MTEIQMTETFQNVFRTFENSYFGHCLRLRLENITDFEFRASDFTRYRVNTEIMYCFDFCKELLGHDLAAGRFRLGAPAAAAAAATRLGPLIFRPAATCGSTATGFGPLLLCPAAARAAATGCLLRGTAIQRQSRAGDEAHNTQSRQNLLKLLAFHVFPPFFVYSRRSVLLLQDGQNVRIHPGSCRIFLRLCASLISSSAWCQWGKHPICRQKILYLR
jgi:hypothetical protein